MTLSTTPPLTGMNVFSDWEGASIQLQVDENTQILMRSSEGADISKAIWMIKKVVFNSADSNFGNLPTTRTYYPLDANGFPSKNPEFIAANYSTYTYV